MPTVVIGNNTGDNYSGTDDCYIYGKNPSTNYGSSSTLYFSIADPCYCLIKFPGLSNISETIDVSAASLFLYHRTDNGTAMTLNARRLLRDWAESSVTWNSTGSESWTTSGAQSDDNDRVGTISSTCSAGASLTYKEFTGLADDVEGMKNGTWGNYGWHINRTDSNGGWPEYASSEGTDGQRPYLSVTYTESIVSSLATIINNYRQQGVM